STEAHSYLYLVMTNKRYRYSPKLPSKVDRVYSPEPPQIAYSHDFSSLLNSLIPPTLLLLTKQFPHPRWSVFSTFRGQSRLILPRCTPTSLRRIPTPYFSSLLSLLSSSMPSSAASIGPSSALSLAFPARLSSTFQSCPLC